MAEVTIYHNPRCSKSRETLKLLEARGVEPRIVRYLEEPPSAEELKRLTALLGMAPKDLLRRKEAPFKELDLGRADVTDAQVLNAMAAHPVLIERPIVVKGKKAALGRPPEQVLDIL